MALARRTEAAEWDLQEIAYQIAVIDRRPSTADRIIDELIAQANMLAESSGIALMGTAAAELGNGVRLFSYKRWVLAFRYESHGIDVLRIMDGSQDYLS